MIEKLDRVKAIMSQFCKYRALRVVIWLGAGTFVGCFVLGEIGWTPEFLASNRNVSWVPQAEVPEVPKVLLPLDPAAKEIVDRFMRLEQGMSENEVEAVLGEGEFDGYMTKQIFKAWKGDGWQASVRFGLTRLLDGTFGMGAVSGRLSTANGHRFDLPIRND